jgi:hypothetical protein
MFLFLPAVVARHDNLKTPFRNAGLGVMKMWMLSENVSNRILSGTSDRIRVVVPAQLVERVFRESGTD